MTMSIEHGEAPGVAAEPALPVADPGATADAVHAGVLSGSELIAEYTLRQPAPRQWVAVGLVKPNDPDQGTAARLLVGRGVTRARCLGNLARRVAALARIRDGETRTD